MKTHSIKVIISNPGQVLACLGFMEVADKLHGSVKGWFDITSENHAEFHMTSSNNEVNPFHSVVEFLVKPEVKVICPETKHFNELKLDSPTVGIEIINGKEYPVPLTEVINEKKKKAISEVLPVKIEKDGRFVILNHWITKDGRKSYKTFAGLQCSYKLIEAMIKKIDSIKDDHQLWEKFLVDPFSILRPLSDGRLNYDSRASWEEKTTGFSLDKVKMATEASPCVEILAAIGLENARPAEYESESKHKRTFFVWTEQLPLPVCRIVYSNADKFLPDSKYLQLCFEIAGGKYYKKFLSANFI